VEIIGLENHFPRSLMPLRLARHIRRIAPDLIQTWLYHADLIGGVAARLARPFGPPIPVAWGVRQSVVNQDLLKPA
ncbi:MAG TPA: group 1 glycosyl transferase, partial [Alphaproteobacteria bacterium]|nr:group 1 glycosyl transferase [Alphaproteobacteria bacterium]